MKKLAFFFSGLLFLSATCFAQGVRMGDGQPVWRAVTVPGVAQTLIGLVPSAGITICSSPANAVPCTNKVPTYTDITLTSQCSLANQVVLASTSSCVANTDTLGNWGVWVAPGEYDYTITVNGASSGPYHLTASPPASGTSAMTAASFNGTGAAPFLWNGVQIGCSVLIDCSNLLTAAGPSTPVSMNLMTANNLNSVQLLCQQGPLGAISGQGATVLAVYQCVIPQNTPGAGKCIRAEVDFLHTGANNATYNWSWVKHLDPLANSGISVGPSNVATDGQSEIRICNAAGLQTSQTLSQKPTSLGTTWFIGGKTPGVIDISATGGADLTFTFAVNAADTVTPLFFLVTEIL